MANKLALNNYLYVALFTLSIGFTGCGQQVVNTSVTQATETTQTTKLKNNLPRVVATTTVLCDLTKQIAGDTINLICLIPPGKNPHSYQPTREDRKAIQQAKLIFYNGYNFEPILIKIIKTTKSPAPKIAVGQIAVPKPKQYFKAGKKVADPHLWHNVKNSINMLRVINSNLAKLAPANSKKYSSNTRRVTNELTQLDKWVKSRVASIPPQQLKLFTTDDALGYYAKAYGFSDLRVLQGINTQVKAKNMAKDIQQAKVPTIFAQSTTNSNIIESIAGELEVRVSQRQLYADGLGEPGSDAETYQKMIVANTRTIVEGLGGTYLKFEP